MKVAMAPPPILAAVAVVVGAVAGLALSLLSRPAEADPRMAQIRDTMARVQQLKNQPGAPGALPLGAVCASEPAKAVDAYKAVVTTAAGRHKLPASGLRVVRSDASSGELTPIGIQWEGAGEYSAFVGALTDLAAEKPTLFVEALDIKPRGSRVEFELKGRVWCWTLAANRS